MNRRAAVLVTLLISACASPRGAWPTLAQRPGEESGPRALEVAAPQTGDAERANSVAVALSHDAGAAASTRPAAQAAGGSTDDASARLAFAKLSDIEAEISRLEEQWTRQKAAFDAAARAGRPREADWATAQLELTRLERIGLQIEQVRSALDRVAGSLALAAANGQVVARPLAAAGHAIGRVEAMSRRHAAALEEARRLGTSPPAAE